jgi:hypothetical protein
MPEKIEDVGYVTVRRAGEVATVEVSLESDSDPVAVYWAVKVEVDPSIELVQSDDAEVTADAVTVVVWRDENTARIRPGADGMDRLKGGKRRAALLKEMRD